MSELYIQHELLKIWKLVFDGHNEMVGDLDARFLLSQIEPYNLCGCKFCEAMKQLIFLECDVTMAEASA